MYSVQLIIGLIVVPVLRLMKALHMVLTSNVNASYHYLANENVFVMRQVMAIFPGFSAISLWFY
jgi:hypothetical protein